MATRVHFVYPHRPRISCPSAIGRKVGQRLRARGYEVVHYDIDEARLVRPGPDDVLLGHPHEAPWSVFRRSAARPGWRRRLLLMPYVHVDDHHVALAEPVIRRCDLFLAITGRTWFDDVPRSPAAHWAPRMVHVDLAVDPDDFPRVKGRFERPGRRRFLYIGHTGWYKNTPYLSEVARRLPGSDFAWIGGDDPQAIAGVRPLGRRDFTTAAALELVGSFDFLVTVGSGDANPATILEAMAWGLVPVCTPESGYAGYPGIANVPLGDAEAAAAVLRDLQAAPEERLDAMRAANDDALRRHFTWDRFTDQVVSAIESDERPALLPVPPSTRARLRARSTAKQLSVLRPAQARASTRSLLASTALGRRLLAAWRRRPGSERRGHQGGVGLGE